ncbi:MAG: transcriptional repressor [Clostridia bacterium]|nr:transcriptional repressor [Clostridia bacterium]
MSYMTSQRKALFEALESHRDEALSADQITALLGERASRSAVYRNLSALEAQGLLKKTTASGSSKALYRYTGSEQCRDHLHLECSKCGRTFHLMAPTTDAVIDNVLRDANFSIDRTSTVLYGVCEKCRDN